MKRLHFLLLASIFCIAPFLFGACEKEKNNEADIVDYEAGKIPGLGETEGELTGTAFKFPEGIELIENITGNGSQYGYWTISESAKSYSFVQKDGTITTRELSATMQAGENRGYFGSGCGFVDLLIPIRNTTSGEITVTFPAATILRSKKGDTQNGILIKKVTVKIPAKTDYNLYLAFYCGNASKGTAGGTDIYELSVVSNAKPLLDLCARVKDKKINLEDHSPSDLNDQSSYSTQVNNLQLIVWEVTDGTGLSELSIEYINSLPNV